MGAFGLAPYFKTTDPRTPNSYESIAFREIILRYISEANISLVSCASPGVVQSELRDLKRRIEQQEFGAYDLRSSNPILLKYPFVSVGNTIGIQ